MSRFGFSSVSREKKVLSAKVIASCAFLAAISIVMARILSFSTPDGIRWSLDKFPLFLAGMLFGPMVGAMTGFVADFIGSLMQFGFNPFLCPPAILYGLFGGLFRLYLAKDCSPLRLGIAYAFPIVIGSILYQSCTLAYFFFDEGFAAGLVYYLTTRTFQFSIMLVVEVLILLSLMKANVFTRLGLWPPKSLKQSAADPSATYQKEGK